MLVQSLKNVIAVVCKEYIYWPLSWDTSSQTFADQADYVIHSNCSKPSISWIILLSRRDATVELSRVGGVYWRVVAE